MIQECSSCGECKWQGEQEGDQWGFADGGHSEKECIDACKEKQQCNYASISSTGYCHMSATCNEKSGDSWSRFQKIGKIGMLSDLALSVYV